MDPEELYRLPPEQFTAARDEAARAAKADGDADRAGELKALRRPSVSAWLVNLLVHEQQDLVEQLLDLGPALAQAQAAGQGDELRALSAQRRDLMDAVVAQAAGLADRPVAAAVRDEVAATLETGLADPAAAEAVRSGRLVRALSYAGFGGLDLEGAVALTAVSAATTRRPRKPSGHDAEQVATAEAAALDAAGRLDDAVRACEQAQREQAEAHAHAERASSEVERLRRQLAEAEEAAKQADAARRHAEKEAAAAVDTVRKRQATEEKARAELDRLRRNG